jgi:hypothetical protein
MLISYRMITMSVISRVQIVGYLLWIRFQVETEQDLVNSESVKATANTAVSMDR